MFLILEYGTPPGGFGDTVYRSAACPPGDVVHCVAGVKCDETSVIANKSRGFVTGTAFRGYCVSGNLLEMPYPLTQLVKAHAAGGSCGLSMSGR
jgi:hypothetical protein